MGDPTPKNAENPQLKPIGLLGTVLFMGIPGLLMLVLMRFGVPWATEAGLSQLVAFWVALYTPCLLVGVMALVCYRKDGHPMNWPAFRRRMRLESLSGKVWAIVLGTTVLCLFLENVVFASLPAFLAQFEVFAPPDWLNAPLNPLKEFDPAEFLGLALAGQWWVPVAYIPCLLINILGEELFWRGYLLPRQELRFGKWAWLVNGIFWIVLFHLSMPWIWLAVIPSLVLVPLAAQRLQSTWAPIVIHGMGNLLFLPVLIWGVVG